MRLLDRAAGPNAIVLHEQANRGETILEKFERHAQAASFAVVLLTGDDEGRLRGGDGALTPRGRQNVIFELGVFIGALGRSNVAVLMDDVEKPSDINGLVYIPLDAAGAWRHSLLKELQAAGIEVDFNRIP
jgi:predicted nucleotide-binding protein